MMKLKLFCVGVALLFAQSAEAQTWIGYEATGIGSRTQTNQSGVSIAPAVPFSFSLNFSVLSSGSIIESNGVFYSSDGSYFTARVPPSSSNYTFDGRTSGVITIGYRQAYSGGGSEFNANIGYADTDTNGGFPLAASSTVGTGSFGFRSFDGFGLSGNYFMVGTISTFRVVGEVAGFQGFGLSTSPLPETATWGMMIAGFGMMGAALRSRRRSTKVSFA